jgi:hypothetical protein
LSRAICDLLRDSAPSTEESDANPFPINTSATAVQRAAFDLIGAHFRHSVIADLPQIDQQAVFKIILHLFAGLSTEQYSQRSWPPPQQSVLSQVVVDAKSFLEDAWKSSAKQGVIDAVVDVVKAADIDAVVTPCVGTMLLGLSDNVVTGASSAVIPALFSRLAKDPPPTVPPSLRTLLRTLSVRYPQIFYKPLFACAASDKEEVIKEHLVTLHVVSALVGPILFYFRDAEMITVALMADVGKGNHDPNWAAARLGQAALLLELISVFAQVRASKSDLVGCRTTSAFVYLY